MTNKELSKRDSFKQVCSEAGVEPTKRQVSKLRNKHGKLYNYLKGVGYDQGRIRGFTS